MNDILELIRIFKPASLRFDIAHWSSANTYFVAIRDGGTSLIEVQKPTLEAAWEELMRQARAKKPERRVRSKADLLG